MIPAPTANRSPIETCEGLTTLHFGDLLEGAGIIYIYFGWVFNLGLCPSVTLQSPRTPLPSWPPLARRLEWLLICCLFLVQQPIPDHPWNWHMYTYIHWIIVEKGAMGLEICQSHAWMVQLDLSGLQTPRNSNSNSNAGERSLHHETKNSPNLPTTIHL